VRSVRRPLFALLAAAFLVPTSTLGQETTPITVPTVQETQTFTLTVPTPGGGARARLRTRAGI
jgi:hypothetical protein